MSYLQNYSSKECTNIYVRIVSDHLYMKEAFIDLDKPLRISTEEIASIHFTCPFLPFPLNLLVLLYNLNALCLCFSCPLEELVQKACAVIWLN